MFRILSIISIMYSLLFIMYALCIQYVFNMYSILMTKHPSVALSNCKWRTLLKVSKSSPLRGVLLSDGTQHVIQQCSFQWTTMIMFLWKWNFWDLNSRSSLFQLVLTWVKCCWVKLMLTWVHQLNPGQHLKKRIQLH